MAYLLDTGVLTAYLQQRPAIKVLVEPWILQGIARTSLLVYGEIVEYFYSLPNATQRITQLQTLVNVMGALNVTLSIEDRYATVRRALRPPHGPGIIGDIDTLIAATAVEHQLTLVTADSDFQRVTGLAVMLIPRSQLKA
jgi:predicted nucleic acid-binding protein